MIKRLMENKLRFSSLTVAIALLGQSAWAIDLNKRLDVSTDTREPVFGQIYYDYHMGHRFSALNATILEKNKGMFTDEDAETESLLGDLYTEFGLPREADAALSRVQSQDIPSSTRNMPWLRYGKYLSQLGNDVTTENYLRKPPSNLTSFQESERRLLLANTLIRKKSYPEAVGLLLDMPAQGALASYGLYNLGIAYLQDGQTALGIFNLNEMIRLANDDEESRSLKDKAALAIAYRYLQDGDYSSARDSLLRVRLEGPYSNSSLLTLAYSYYLNKQYQQALPALLELQRRNPADPSVQEAYLLAGRAYEDLGARNQAVASYRIAALTLRDQLTQLERTALRIDEEAWPDILSPMQVNTDDADPLNIKDIPATNNAITAGLFAKLFASASFNEGFKAYRQLVRMQDLLSVRLRDINALEENAKILEDRQSSLMDKEAQLKSLRENYVSLVKKWQANQIRAKRMGSNADAYTEAATQAETARLQQINRLARKITKSGLDPKQTQELTERLDRLRNLTQFEVARHAASRDDIYRKLQESTEQLKETKIRLNALETLFNDNKQVIAEQNSKRFGDLRDKTEKLKTQIAETQAAQKNQLRDLAKTLLEDRRKRLTTYITETYLGMERVENKTNSVPPKASDK